MSRNNNLFLALGVLFLFGSCTSSKDQSILAKVGNDTIRVADLKMVFKEQSDSYGPDLLKDPEGNLAIKKILLNGLIEEKILLQRAQEKNISLTPDEEKELQNHLKSGYNEGELESILGPKKISPEDWFNQQKRKRLIEKLLSQEIYSTIHLSEQDISNFYQKNHSSFEEPDRVHCRHIVANKQEKAAMILSLLKEGENFANLAKKYSESPDGEKGGDLGFVGMGELPALFEKTCFTLNTGQTSEVLHSDYGYHIFRVVEKKPGRQMTLAEASPTISARLKEAMARPLLRTWLDEIQKDKKITVDETALKGVSLEAL